MLLKETRCIKSRGWKLFEFEDQGKLYLICLPGNMQVSYDLSYFVKITHIFTDSARGSQTFKQHCIYIYIYIYIYILGVARYMYSYRTVTVQASRFGARCLTTNTGNSPQSRRGRRSNAMLFDNRQQKNSECQRWHRGGRADVWLTVFYFDKVPTGCQVSNAGSDVCVRVCVHECVRVWECVCVRVCVRECVCVWRDQLFPYTSRINFKHLLSY